MTDVLGEAYEGVEDGVLSQDDFRDFVFANPVRLWTSMNPDFFAGTAIESQVHACVAQASDQDQAPA